MVKKYYLFVFICVLFSAPLSAEQWQAGHWYIDGGLGLINFDDGFDEISPTNIYVRGGYYINQNFNIGLESSATISPDQIPSVPTVDFDVNIVTIYLRAGAPVSETIMIYAQIGSSNTELTAEGPFGGTFSQDDSDVMVGFGAEIGLGEGSTYLALNFSGYNDNDGVEVTGFNIGLGGRF